MTMNKPELEPCPFCGVSPVIRKGGEMNYRAACGNVECPTMPESRFYDTEAEAIAAWNTRPAQAGNALERIRTEFLPAILHGNEAHRTWLREAVDCFLAGEPVPPPTGKGTQPVDATEGVAIALSAAVMCDWPVDGKFTFHDEPGEHDPCYVVMPDGAMLPLNHHNEPGVDIFRAKFIIAACNDRYRTRPPSQSAEEATAAYAKNVPPETLPEAFDRHVAAKDAKIARMRKALRNAADSLFGAGRGYDARQALAASTDEDALPPVPDGPGKPIRCQDDVAEIALLREALKDCAEPMRVLRRQAEADGAVLNSTAVAIANNASFVKGIARDALTGRKGDA